MLVVTQQIFLQVHTLRRKHLVCDLEYSNFEAFFLLDTKRPTQMLILPLGKSMVNHGRRTGWLLEAVE